MSKMQIPLNGSNFINKDRLQAFQKSLEDDHKINYAEDPKVNISQQEPAEKNYSTQASPTQPGSQIKPLSSHQEPAPGNHLDQALLHTYNHQRRTMDIHQQYLAQQTEYIQLITTVLDQQGKALNFQDDSVAPGMIETFQRTLDNFHAIREQGVEIHREFLSQQAVFSERYLNALENGHQSPPIQQEVHSAPVQSQQVMEWVVQQPPIVLDEHERQPVNTSDPPKALPPEIIVSEGKSGGVTLDELTKGLLEIVAEKTGYPADMLELEMDLEADLGIDSIKRVEILGSLEERYPSLPPADTEVLSQIRTLQEIIQYMDNEAGGNITPSPSPTDDPPTQAQVKPQVTSEADSSTDHPDQAPSSSELVTVLIKIVAEKTGYPSEMLELDMDMEADLGIDSIKRVEILGAMEEQVPGLPRIEAEILSELRTLGQIVELMGSSVSTPASISAEEPEEKKKLNPIGVDITSAELEILPSPDWLDFEIPPDRPLILTGDGTELAVQLRSALVNSGWKTILWQFPDEITGDNQIEIPADALAVSQPRLGKDAIQATLDRLKSDHGIPAGFIHLHPLQEKASLFSEQENQIIKQVFFIASALQADLDQADPAGRNLFLSITRTDGALGFQNQEEFLEGSGLTGLVKSLGWEWPEVFCRAIDFSREMSSDEISQLLLKEIHDPSRIVTEVGLSPGKRVTIKRENGSKV